MKILVADAGGVVVHLLVKVLSIGGHRAAGCGLKLIEDDPKILCPGITLARSALHRAAVTSIADRSKKVDGHCQVRPLMIFSGVGCKNPAVAESGVSTSLQDATCEIIGNAAGYREFHT